MRPGSPKAWRSRALWKRRTWRSTTRFANGQRDQLAMLAADLVRRPVTLIVAGGAAAARAARAATATIPIVAVSGFDLARLRLAASLDPPGRNVTRVTFTTTGPMNHRLAFLPQPAP